QRSDHGYPGDPRRGFTMRPKHHTYDYECFDYNVSGQSDPGSVHDIGSTAESVGEKPALLGSVPHAGVYRESIARKRGEAARGNLTLLPELRSVLRLPVGITLRQCLL